MFGIFETQKKVENSHTPLTLFNTASGKKEIFEPIDESEVTMYTCGPTVYDHIHIGNLRAFLLPDLLKRTLEYNGFSVRNVINFTDFGHLTDDGDEGEDKMMKALKREGKPVTLAAMKEVSAIYIDSFKEDLETFNILPPTKFMAASDYVKEQIALIETLENKGYTYETSDGVYFDVSKFPTYGTLGNIDLDKLKEGARIEVNTEKRHPADFALWKKGLLGWDSRWGKGFPGWHIECAAMVFSALGKQIDIHTGGEDLMYTHHNGEIAEAEAITKKQYVRYWLHNRHVSVDDKKLAKSAGNSIRLSQLKERGYPPETYRYWLLTGHYRSPMNFTFEALDGAKQALYRLKRHIFEEFKNKTGDVDESYRQKFLAAINNDLDTPKTVALLWEVVKDDSVSPEDKVATLREMDKVLALGLSDEPSELQQSLGIIDAESVPEEVRGLIAKRETARTEKNWQEADRLREEINLLGYLVEDTASGPRITKAS